MAKKTAKPKYTLIRRTHAGHTGITLQLLYQDGVNREGYLVGSLIPEAADRVVELMQMAGASIVREHDPYVSQSDSRPITNKAHRRMRRAGARAAARMRKIPEPDFKDRFDVLPVILMQHGGRWIVSDRELLALQRQPWLRHVRFERRREPEARRTVFVAPQLQG